MIAFCVGILALCTGCSLSDWVAETFPPIGEYELWAATFAPLASHSSPYRTRHIDELIAERGPPDAVFEARPRYGDYRGGIPALSYVYRPAAGETCHDTYVVIAATGVISRYYCR